MLHRTTPYRQPAGGVAGAHGGLARTGPQRHLTDFLPPHGAGLVPSASPRLPWEGESSGSMLTGSRLHTTWGSGVLQALWGPCRRGWAWKVVTLEAVGWGRGGDPRRLAGRPWFRGAWACMHVCLTCVCVCARVPDNHHILRTAGPYKTSRIEKIIFVPTEPSLPVLTPTLPAPENRSWGIGPRAPQERGFWEETSWCREGQQQRLGRLRVGACTA